MNTEHCESISEWSQERLENELVASAVHVARHTARFLDILIEVDCRQAFASQGFHSLADWLGWRVSMSLGAAREHVRVARALAELPASRAAFGRGELSFSKIRAITRVAHPDTEEKILALAPNATAGQLERILALFRRADGDAEREQANRIVQRRGVELFTDDDGMLVLRARLAPEEGALVQRALEDARRKLWDREQPPADVTAAGARADAFVLMADRSLAATAGRTGDQRTQVFVHVDAALLADQTLDGESRIDGGPNVPAETSRRLACDAALVPVQGAGEPDGPTAGRRTRVFSAALRRALHLRDAGRCRFPGCSCRITDAHHIVHWANGGPTVLDNAALLCRRHHTLVHEGGYRVEMSAGGPVFFTPNGTKIPDAMCLPGDAAPLPPPRCEDARLLTAPWDGGRVDYAAAVEWLMT